MLALSVSTLHTFNILILFLSPRVLVFSQRAVTNVEIYIDGTFLGQAEQAKGPLYTLPWDPKSFSAGLHTLRVKVQVIDLLVVKIIIFRH